MPPCNQIRQTIQSADTGRRQNAGPIQGDALMGSCVKEPFILTLGGRIRCPRCQAKSKRTKQQCRSPAIRGKRVCKVHGARQPGREPNKAEFCAVLQRRYTAVRHALSALNVNGRWLN